MRARRSYIVLFLTLLSLLGSVLLLLFLGNRSVRAQRGETNPLTPLFHPIPPTYTHAVDVEVVGHLGGDAQVVFATEEYVLAGFGPRLVVLDVASPSAPTELGKLVLPGFIKDIKVVGQYAYVSAGDAGLRLIDMSQPAAPVEVGFYSTKPYESHGLTVVGNYAYLRWYPTEGRPELREAGLWIIDVSEPTRPRQVGEIRGDAVENLNSSLDVEVVGQYAYLAGGSCLEVWDVSTPGVPVMIGSRCLQSPGIGGGDDIKIVGSYAYLVGTNYNHGQAGSLSIIDISDPAMPVELGGYPIPLASAVSIRGTVAYVASGPHGLRVLDISDPRAPREVAFYHSGEPTAMAEDVILWGNQLYLADGPAGLRVLNISTPDSPTARGVYHPPYVGRVHEVAVVGEYAYLLDRESHNLLTVDISDPAAARLSMAQTLPYTATMMESANGYLYVLDDETLHILDLTTPTAPSEVGSYRFLRGPYDYFYEMEVVEDYAYILFGYSLYILDISNPAAPIEVGSLATSGYSGLVVRGRYAYVSNAIIDISIPESPVVATHFSGWPSRLALYDGYVYFIRPCVSYPFQFCGGWLDVIDVSHPTLPLSDPVDLIYFERVPSDMRAEGKQLYLWGGAGLQVLDISRPTAPLPVAQYDSAGYASEVVLANNLIFLADEAGGLLILRQHSAVAGNVWQANGLPYMSVTLTLSSGQSTTSDATGRYTLTQILSGTYTLMPTLPGYRFWPPTRTLTVPPPARQQDFTILAGSVSRTMNGNSALTLSYTDTQGLPTELLFPAGVVTQSTTVTLTPTLATHEPDYHFTGHAFEVEATQGGIPLASFAEPVTVTIHYSNAEVVPTRERELVLWGWTGNGWEDAAESCQPASNYQRNEAANRLSVAICQTGRYALFGPTNRVYLTFLGSD